MAENPVVTDRTSGMERAAAREFARNWRLTRNGIKPFVAGIDARNALQQRRRVGMAGILKDLLDRSGLDDAAAIHDGYAVRDFCDDAEVVRDEDHRRARFSLAPREHRQDLRLHSDVERRRGFVRENEFGLSGHRHRNDRALPHPA